VVTKLCDNFLKFLYNLHLPNCDTQTKMTKTKENVIRNFIQYIELLFKSTKLNSHVMHQPLLKCHPRLEHFQTYLLPRALHLQAK